ncbi:hypothetical protein J0K78_14880 [Halobacillus sp. GSS1]|nr:MULTISPECIES: hypothetical protein [Halobacillus]MBN9655566.1 hypothetical protein [Halobacillus sp. GSS1]MEC3882548.1 hypothetical protein [Halobacillus sp. HZG1]
MLKKWMLALGLVSVLTLAACGGEEDGEMEDEQMEEQEQSDTESEDSSE